MTPDEIRNVAIVGHKGTGKTSLVEALLFLSKATPKLGKAGDRVSGLDDSQEEKEHGATLEARLVTFKWGTKKLNVIDTPGEASFAADTRMAMAAADAAILVVSAKDGVQTGAERAFKWARSAGLPCIVVLSKVDDEHARVDEVVAELRTKLGAPVAMMTVPLGTGPAHKGIAAVRTGKAWAGKPDAPGAAAGEVPADAKDAITKARGKLVDDVAGTDDALTEKYLTEGDLSQEELDTGLRKALGETKIVPAYVVSSVMPSGVLALLDGIADLVPSPAARPAWKGTTASAGPVSRGHSTPNVAAAAAAPGAEVERPPSPTAPVSALVFKTRIDPHVGRISYVRVLSGTLHPDANMLNSSQNQKERVGQIQQGIGKEMKPLTEAVAGDLVALPKLKSTRTGETLSDEKNVFVTKPPDLPSPLFSRTLIIDKGAEDKVATALQRLAEEDPGLVHANDELSRAMLLSGLGAMHLEITIERIKRRVGIDCKLGPPKIAYRETVTKRVAGVEGKQKKQSGGHGQFGVCYIEMEPLPRGSGFVFDDAIVGGVIPRQFIPSVEKGIVKAMARGSLAGYPVVDMKVRLVDGKYHSVDSSDAAFQVAGTRAFRAAQVAAGPALLEPYVKLEVTVPGEMMGDVIGDLNSRGGKVLGTDSAAGNSIIMASVPLAATLDYEPKLTGMTSGRGTFTMVPDKYDFCSPQTQDKVIKESGFKPPEDED